MRWTGTTAPQSWCSILSRLLLPWSLGALWGRGAAPPASSIRRSSRTPRPSRSKENTGGAPRGSSNSAKLKGSRSVGVVNMETRGGFNMAAIAEVDEAKVG